ncbi:MAG: hypothetical protein LUE27_08965, partial [Clostridia bacterium]|nr:hypothetical protein [Clostridia bacterium]
MEKETEKKPQGDLNLLQFADAVPDKGIGARTTARIGNELSNSIASPKDPELFNPDNPDTAIRTYQAFIKEEDLKYITRHYERTGEKITIDRKNKPAYFTHTEKMIIVYLASKVSQAYDTNPDIREKIDNPGSKKGIGLNIDIQEVAKLLFTENRPENALKVLEALIRMHSLWQWNKIETEGGSVAYRIFPYINIQDISLCEDLSTAYRNGERGLSGKVGVILGKIFFEGLKSEYAPIIPLELFEAWRKNGGQNELFD